MSHVCTEDLRRRAVMAYERGEGSCAALAAVFALHPRTLERWVARWRKTRSLANRPRGGGWRSPIDVAVVHRLVREVPDATVAEMCAEYNRRVPRTRRTSPSSFHRALVREQFVLKKNGRGLAKSIDPTSPPSAAPLPAGNAAKPPTGWSSSTRPARIWRWVAPTRGSRVAKNTSSPGR
jgi:transposase